MRVYRSIIPRIIVLLVAATEVGEGSAGLVTNRTMHVRGVDRLSGRPIHTGLLMDDTRSRSNITISYSNYIWTLKGEFVTPFSFVIGAPKVGGQRIVVTNIAEEISVLFDIGSATNNVQRVFEMLTIIRRHETITDRLLASLESVFCLEGAHGNTTNTVDTDRALFESGKRELALELGKQKEEKAVLIAIRYFYGERNNIMRLSSDEQIRMALMRLGDITTQKNLSILSVDDKDEEGPEMERTVVWRIDSDVGTRSYKTVFKLHILKDGHIWLPIRSDADWVFGY